MPEVDCTAAEGHCVVLPSHVPMIVTVSPPTMDPEVGGTPMVVAAV
jgi:F0F1-type ATP synthase epsilon subunit